METWQIGDIIYRSDIFTEFIDAFKILHLHINSCGNLVADIESLFTGTRNYIMLLDDKNEDLIFSSDVIYSCNVNRVYEFIQRHTLK